MLYPSIIIFLLFDQCSAAQVYKHTHTFSVVAIN